MKIKAINEPAVNALWAEEVDLFLVSSGYESRARAAAQHQKRNRNSRVKKKIVFAFTEHRDNAVRKKNDKKFKEWGYKSVLCSGSDSRKVENSLLEFLSEHDNKEVSIVVDISSMTRTWYGAIIRVLSMADRKKPVKSTFVYYPAKWSKKADIFAPNEFLGPLPGFASFSLPNKPSSLIIGLGRVPYRALGLRDYLDPQHVLCFYSNPSAGSKYINDIEKANKDLFETLKKEDIYTYNIFDPVASLLKLLSICGGLSRSYRVVLASLGPKIFGLLCFLAAIEIPEISVWRISPASKHLPIDIKPSANPILLEITWST